MSRKDYDRYHDVVDRVLVGHALGLGLPTNSLKLVRDPAAHRENYLWIDPPWVLMTGDSEVASGAGYPDRVAADPEGGS